jgi:hypothetical protein
VNQFLGICKDYKHIKSWHKEEITNISNLYWNNKSVRKEILSPESYNGNTKGKEGKWRSLAAHCFLRLRMNKRIAEDTTGKDGRLKARNRP